MVVGATVGARSPTSGSTSPASAGPLLAPGRRRAGRHGRGDLRAIFGAALPQVLRTSSREVLVAGPDVVALRDAARRAADDLAAALAG